MSHVDEGRLHAFLDGALSAADPADAARVELHLATCADCRTKLEEAARLRDEAAALLGSAQPRPMETPSFEAIRARAAAIDGAPVAETAVDAAGRGRARRALFASPFNGIAWAATVILAVGLGWMLRDTTDDRGLRPMTDISGRTLQTSPQVGAGQIGEEPPVTESVDLGPEQSAAGGLAGAAWADERRAAEATPAAAGANLAHTEEYPVEESAALQAAPPPASARTESRRIAGEPLGAQSERLARQQAAPPGRYLPPAAPPPPAEAIAEDGAIVAWDIVSVAEAERRAGELFILKNARVTSAGVRGAGADLQVRTVQRTSRGETIAVVQRATPVREGRAIPRDQVSSRAIVTGEAAQASVAQADEAAAEPSMPSASSTVRWRDWTVTISGAVAPDRLRELIEELP